MPDIPLRDFRPLVLQYAPAVPGLICDEHVRQAAIRLCTDTRCWRHNATVSVAANPFDIPLPVNAVVHEIEYAEFEGGLELTPASTRDFTEAELRGAAGDANPCWITQEVEDTAIILPLKAGQVSLRLFLKPPAGVAHGNEARNSLPEFMFDHHANYLAAGALATLLLLPNEPFSDPNRATGFAAQFQGRIDAISGSFRSGQQRRRARTRRSPWM